MLVIGFLAGRTLDRRRLRRPRRARARGATPSGGCTPARASSATSTCSPGRRGTSRSSREHGFPLPPAYDDHADAWDDVRRALAAPRRPTVPCNNDLLAGNFIDDGERVWLIDYEYSGNNDAVLRARQHRDRVRLRRRSRSTPGGGLLRRDPTRGCWPGSGSRRCAASTAGRCGASSRPRPARSTSTSTRWGDGSASRRRRATFTSPRASTALLDGGRPMTELDAARARGPGRRHRRGSDRLLGRPTT